MVVGLHSTVRTFDECPLEAASFSVDNESFSEIELGFATPKKRKEKRQRRRVSFKATATIIPIPNTDDFTKEEKDGGYFSPLELQLIKVRLRTEILRVNQQFIASGATKLTPEQEEELRGLEAYVEPTKHSIALRRQQAKDVAFQKGCDAEWIAERYQEITTTSSEIALKLALTDEQQAWPTDEDENAESATGGKQAPLYQIMIR